MEGEPTLVVAAAIMDHSRGGPRLLAAQRARPPELAGWWEFPGGKAGPGENDRAALVRECREELGVEISVGSRLGADLLLADGGPVLRVWTAALASGRPRATEHAAIRWLTGAELFDVAWLPQDLGFVRLLVPLLAP